MGALGTELFAYHKRYYLLAFAIFIGLLFPIPFWLLHRYTKQGTFLNKFGRYINTPILVLYIGYLPYSVNGQWWYVCTGQKRGEFLILVCLPGLAS